jgi:glycosyltransferase involved in cell wall biosynthesis
MSNSIKEKVYRVAIYSPFPNGGMPAYTKEFIHALTKKYTNTINFELVTSEDIELQYKEVEYRVNAILPSIKLSEFSSKAAWLFARIGHYYKREMAFRRWLSSRSDIDAIHFQDYHPWMVPNSINFARSLKKPVFFTVHNVFPHSYPDFIPASFINTLSKRRWRKCDTLFVLGKKLEKTLSSFLGHKHPSIVVIPHGIWSVPPEKTTKTDESKHKRKKLLFFGGIRSNKGVHILLEGMEYLKDFDLTVAGNKDSQGYWDNKIVPLLEKIRKEGGKIDVRDRFIPDDEMAELFRSHDIVVLPYTTFNSQSGVLHLAVAYKKPVVVTDVGAMSEIVNEYGIGEVVPPNDPVMLAQAIRNLSNEKSAEDMREKINKAALDLSWERVAEIAGAVYIKVLSGMNS